MIWGNPEPKRVGGGRYARGVELKNNYGIKWNNYI